MFAAEIHAPSTIRLIDAPEPSLDDDRDDGSGRIVFQPELGCLCGSDVPFFRRVEFGATPQIGHSMHELIGTVVAARGARFSPGDRVLCLPIDQQGLSERFAVSAARALPLDPDTPPEHSVLAQPLGTVIHALRKMPNMIDQDVAIVGQGPMGQLFTACMRMLGARRIIAVDRLASRLAVSPRMGATDVVDCSATDPVQAVADLTGGAMADVVVEVVGHADQALDLCIELCRPFGRLLLFGIPPVATGGAQLFPLLRANATLYTSATTDFRHDFPLAQQWIAQRRLDVSPLVTHRFDLCDLQQAFDTFAERREGALKVFVDFQGRR